ncbi:hypothetical protein [Haloplanus halophilus]|uniref:hypothetical protein n=1 Tax=Haloplanus halophilus TaxID=2949993 RepID=UPI002040E4A4|nr:hypothetical protein [Haloplanus sp. GDY1]
MAEAGGEAADGEAGSVEGPDDGATEGAADEGRASGADPLLAWTLASFHAATLVVGPVLLLYAVDALGSLLQGVRTVTGLGLYLALWVLTWWTNRRWLAATDLRGLRGTVVPGATWGAITGVGFLLVLLVAVGVIVREPLLVAALAVGGMPVSALVGALAGAGFAVLDLLIVEAGRRLAGGERAEAGSVGRSEPPS